MKDNISRSSIFRDKMRKEAEKRKEEFDKKVDAEIKKREKNQDEIEK